MIDGKIKKKLLEEIAKFGNIYLSCLKVGINKATFYRWKKNSKKFEELANEARRIGRENICDIAEHALLRNVKNGNQKAIEYTLNHNSKIYKRKDTDQFTIFHKKDAPPPQKGFKCLEELIADAQREREQNMYDYLTQGGKEIPPKPDGSPIEISEVFDYEEYTKNWQKRKGLEKLTGIVDSKSEMDKPQEEPSENSSNKDKDNLE